MDDFFDGSDLNDMNFNEFIEWLYENRNMLFGEDDYSQEYMNEDEVPFGISIHEDSIENSKNIIADQYGPYVVFRN